MMRTLICLLLFFSTSIAEANAREKGFEMVRSLNRWLDRCTVLMSDITDEDASGWFEYHLSAQYDNGTVDGPTQFRTLLDIPIDEEVRMLLDLVGPQVFFSCSKRITPKPAVDPTVGGIEDARQHVTQVLNILNTRLEGCVIRRSSDVTTPSADGRFNFLIEALYSDTSSDRPVVRQTSLANTIESDVSTLLTVIPSTIFTRCRLAGGTVPDDPVQLSQEHALALVRSLNAALNECQIGLWGSLSIPDTHGDFFIFLIAVFDDGSFDNPVRFQANFHDTATAASTRLLQLIPAIEFTRCR